MILFAHLVLPPGHTYVRTKVCTDVLMATQSVHNPLQRIGYDVIGDQMRKL